VRYADYEDLVTRAIEDRDVCRSDAQAIIEAHPEICRQGYHTRRLPSDVADLYLDAKGD
jgi:hypothetical protein